MKQNYFKRMVFLPNIQPHPALRPYVRHYLLVHVPLKGVPAHQRIKPVPPDADQSLYFYPRSDVKVIINSTAETRTSAASIFVVQQTARINLEFGEDHLIIQVCFRPGFLYQFLGKMPLSTFQEKEFNAEDLNDTGIKELNEQLREETDYQQMIALIETYLLKKNRQTTNQNPAYRPGD